MSDFAQDLSDSAFEFQRVVWPHISRWFGGGELVPVEAVAAEGFAKKLDTLAGIDAWQVHDSNGIRGIASRVQWDDGRPGFPYQTFTVRKQRFNGSETEYAKRTRAVKEPGGWLFPYLTCHAYLSLPKREGSLMAVAMASTKHVLDFIEHSECSTRNTTNASFYVAPWDAMITCGFTVKVWQASKQTPQNAASNVVPFSRCIHKPEHRVAGKCWICEHTT